MKWADEYTNSGPRRHFVWPHIGIESQRELAICWPCGIWIFLSLWMDVYYREVTSKNNWCNFVNRILFFNRIYREKYYRLWSYRLVHGKWNLLVTDILSMSDIFKKHVLLFYIVFMSLGVLGCSNYTCIEFPLSFQSTSYKPHKLWKELQFAK